MPKITVMVGISGSGKSTAVNNIKKPGDVIVSRDKLREMLFGYTPQNVADYYQRADVKDCEKQVSDYHKQIIREALLRGENVIADNTHLQKKYLNSYKDFAYPLEYQVIDTPLDICIERDAKRIRSVGPKIINKQHKAFLNIKKDYDFSSWAPPTLIQGARKTPAIVCDLDGTLCDIRHRNPFDVSRLMDDKVNTNVHNILRKLMQDHTIVLCSGRAGEAKEDTEKWLAKHDIKYDILYMRAPKDYRKDWLIKQEFWQQLENAGHDIKFMMDDRNQVVDRARALGYNVLQVDYGSF